MLRKYVWAVATAAVLVAGSCCTPSTSQAAPWRAYYGYGPGVGYYSRPYAYARPYTYGYRGPYAYGYRRPYGGYGYYARPYAAPYYGAYRPYRYW